MYWVEIDGVRLPRRVAGDVVLDFANTFAGWDDPRRLGREWLTDYHLFLRWSTHAEVLDNETAERLGRSARRSTSRARDALDDAVTLRRAVHTVALDPASPSGLRTISEWAREAARHGAVVATDSGPRWRLARGAGLGTPGLLLARAAEELLTGPDLRHVKACPGVGCGWLFLDRSGRRRWCSMADCGNRAKVAAHARRQRAGR